eukprot:gnl/TRDRNA2_/TRDRNA2_92729_c0_seq2.p1 gnl/TRDRNA2_/TRDRNA2_92729_c0~~gnl/TRDRNA2_/TRDRNA2_92729_c0_seq2.p1  ORF type:complete len:382 (+),score=52.65 gnl/TRDRNA2_/TRDRNA2_92729_c0_seq2:164-1309(+)
MAMLDTACEGEAARLDTTIIEDSDAVDIDAASADEAKSVAPGETTAEPTMTKEAITLSNPLEEGGCDGVEVSMERSERSAAVHTKHRTRTNREQALAQANALVAPYRDEWLAHRRHKASEFKQGKPWMHNGVPARLGRDSSEGGCDPSSLPAAGQTRRNGASRRARPEAPFVVGSAAALLSLSAAKAATTSAAAAMPSSPLPTTTADRARALEGADCSSSAHLPLSGHVAAVRSPAEVAPPAAGPLPAQSAAAGPGPKAHRRPTRKSYNKMGSGDHDAVQCQRTTDLAGSWTAPVRPAGNDGRPAPPPTPKMTSRPSAAKLSGNSCAGGPTPPLPDTSGAGARGAWNGGKEVVFTMGSGPKCHPGVFKPPTRALSKRGWTP